MSNTAITPITETMSVARLARALNIPFHNVFQSWKDGLLQPDGFRGTSPFWRSSSLSRLSTLFGVPSPGAEKTRKEPTASTSPSSPWEAIQAAVKAAVETALANCPAFVAKQNEMKAAQTARVMAMVKFGLNPSKPAIERTAEAPSTFDLLEKAGKFEELYAILPKEEQRQHMGPKAFAAFKRAMARGVVRYHERVPNPRFTVHDFARKAA